MLAKEELKSVLQKLVEIRRNSEDVSSLRVRLLWRGNGKAPTEINYADLLSERIKTRSPDPLGSTTKRPTN